MRSIVPSSNQNSEWRLILLKEKGTDSSCSVDGLARFAGRVFGSMADMVVGESKAALVVIAPIKSERAVTST